jgi:molybdate transport system regulatory protein
MSYRCIWLLIDELNRLFEAPVVETKHGGSAGGGADLTPFGHLVVQHYRTIERKAHRPRPANLPRSRRRSIASIASF